MDTEQIIGIVVALAGSLGLQQTWGLLKNKLDAKHKKEEKSTDYKERRISELELELKKANKTIIDLTLRLGKLEERVLHIARGRIKNKDNN